MKRFTIFLFIFLFLLCDCFAYSAYITSKYAATQTPATPFAGAQPTATSFNGPQPTVIPFVPGQQQREFTFVNHTGQTIWVGAAGSVLVNNGGWKLDVGQVDTIPVPNGWTAGRFWGRTGCTFDSSGTGSCETGDCAGRLQCNGATGTATVSLAEFTLNGGDNDTYDTSYVDAFNVPVTIRTSNTPSPSDSRRCGNAGNCSSDMLPACPSELQKKDASGKVIACMSPCTVFHTDQYCCTGAYLGNCGDPTQWPIPYVPLVRKVCPTAYSYPADDPNGTFTCTTNCNYQITFGPLGST